MFSYFRDYDQNPTFKAPKEQLDQTAVISSARGKDYPIRSAKNRRSETGSFAGIAVQ
jgi:hypothetical protein